MMIDVSRKKISKREAIAEAKVFLNSSVIDAIQKNKVPKGDVLEAAKFAGISAAKKTYHLIPLCHPILVEYVDIRFEMKKEYIKVRTTVRGTAKTGFEMEALTAVAVASLTIYDMCKQLDRGIVISDVKLVKKSGGKSGVCEVISRKS